MKQLIFQQNRYQFQYELEHWILCIFIFISMSDDFTYKFSIHLGIDVISLRVKSLDIDVMSKSMNTP